MSDSFTSTRHDVTTPALPTQKMLTTMISHLVAQNPLDQMFAAGFDHFGLHWQFWKCDVAMESHVMEAIEEMRAPGSAGTCKPSPPERP